MKIINARRISQVFFFCWFMWFCIVNSFGAEWWKLRGWSVNLILQLDPLVAIGTLLTTHTIYKGLIWALATIILALLFGRVFCGWICPFGTLNQFFGYLGNRKRKLKGRINSNKYRKAASLKYLFLIAFLAAAAIPLGNKTRLFTGLIDPIPFMYRSVNMIVIPVADGFVNLLSIEPRVYTGGFFIGLLFITFLFLNLFIPRFYCRFICPTGALLGLISRYSVWRIVKSGRRCTNCMQCEQACEGGCEPSGNIRINECVLCFNCYDQCRDRAINYSAAVDEEGQISRPDLTRRGLILSSLSGLIAIQLFPLSKGTAAAGDNLMIRPPGSLPEEEFLQRCIKCGQCMRVCPSNIIMPSGLFEGIEKLWTPVLNFTEGTSGCQLNCTACGQVCPTSAIRPISLSEKLGVKEFAQKGPIRMGSAYVDRSRCLPWAMHKPCIVCQENCPVTPKAIYITEKHETVRSGEREILSVEGLEIHVSGPSMEHGQYATGDYYVVIDMGTVKQEKFRIVSNSEGNVTINSKAVLKLKKGDKIAIQVCLHQPNIDLERCTGCGTCVHECPVGGTRAIRVTSDNESRSMKKIV